MRVLLVYNPISGRGTSCKLAGEYAELFLKLPCDVQLIQTEPTSPEQWLRPTLEFNPDSVIVIGGDGTLRQVASVLTNTKIPLFHIACGTENLFAKSMGMMISPESVIATIKQGKTKTIDTAHVNGAFMILMASVGFDANVVADLAKHRGSSITHLSYVAPILRQLLNWKPPTVSVTVDNKEIVKHQMGWAIVANSKAYARGLNPARNADIADGKLDVMFLPLKGRLSLWKWIRYMKRGIHLHHPDVVYIRGEDVEVKTSEPSPWQIDGDPSGIESKVNVVCNPNSLCILE